MKIETKATFTVSEAGELEGVAWPFGTPDRVGDVIEKGAFAHAAGKIVPMLAFHDDADPVGAWTSIVETPEGLTVKGKLTMTVRRAQEVRDLIKDGAIGGLSIGFITRKAAPRRGGGRTISELDLVEVSLVTVPSHPGAKITSAKSASPALAIAEALHKAASAYRT